LLMVLYNNEILRILSDNWIIPCAKEGILELDG
jgi:hypothetical protein